MKENKWKEGKKGNEGKKKMLKRKMGIMDKKKGGRLGRGWEINRRRRRREKKVQSVINTKNQNKVG